MGAKYIVEIDLRKTGDFGASAMQKATHSAGGLDARFAGIKSRFAKFGDEIDSLTGKVTGLAYSFAKWAIVGGTAAAVGAVTYGVASLNKEAEGAMVSLGAILNAQGMSGGIDRGIGMAADLVAKMRKDAALLPGEFQDLRNIYVTGATPAFQAGMSSDAFRKLSSQIMAAGAVSQLPMDMVARESAQLLSGRSGAHNVFGTRIMGLTGKSAEEFNKLDPAKRIERITEALAKYEPVIAKYAETYDAKFTTAVDNAKQLARVATAPLFERAKGVLEDINSWFTANQIEIERWATNLGQKFGLAFDKGRAALEQWWPAISAFASNAWDKITAIWIEATPYVERFATWMQEALKDPGTIDKLITLAKLYIGYQMATSAGGKLGGALLAQGMGIGVGAAGGAVGWGAAASSLGAMVLPAAMAAAALTALYGASEYYSSWQKQASYRKQEEAAATGDVTSQLAKFTMVLDATSDSMSGVQSLFSALGKLQGILDLREYNAQNAALEYKLGGTIQGKKPVEFEYGMTYEQLARKASMKHPGGGGGTNIQKVEIVVTTNANPNRVARTVFDELGRVAKSKRFSTVANNFSSSRPV